MLPEVFDDCNVQRLALFFRNLRDTLRALAPIIATIRAPSF